MEFFIISMLNGLSYGLLLFNGNDNEVDHVPIRSSSNPVE